VVRTEIQPPALNGETVAATLDIFVDTPNINRWIFERLAPWCGKRVLEVGSGIGNLTRLMLERELVVATDVDPTFVERLRGDFSAHANVAVESLNLESVPVEALRRHRVDSILCVNVLEHVRDDAGALAALAEVVQPNGRLLLYVPALPWLHGSIDTNLGHHRRYGRAELLKKLEPSWRVLHVSYMNLLGIPGWFVNSRLLRRRLLPVKQVRLYDRLTPLLRWEDHVRLPLGMSLVVAAERR
jgi:SAM-dependent methyltransferase